MNQPGCSRANESTLPSVEELDRTLSTSAGSPLDQVGTRYTMTSSSSSAQHNTGVVWETTEVLTIQQGQSLLFSPTWYHRVIPASAQATHSAMTLVVKYKQEPSIMQAKDHGQDRNVYLLKPLEVTAPNTHKWVCYSLVDLFLVLTDPNLDVEQGLPRFPCTEDTVHSPKDDFLQPTTLRQQQALAEDEL